MKSKKILKSALMATTFLCTTAYTYADSSVVVTEQNEASTGPVHAIANTVSDVVKTGVDAVKNGTEAVTNTVKDTDSNTEAPNPVVIKTDSSTSQTVIKHHHRRGYLNGYKGYHHPRPHYARYSDGWYYPDVAFKNNGETIRTKVISTAVGDLPVDHIRYCQSHYRSYRLSDNSFQPYHGPRQQCTSSYYRGNN